MNLFEDAKKAALELANKAKETGEAAINTVRVNASEIANNSFFTSTSDTTTMTLTDTVYDINYSYTPEVKADVINKLVDECHENSLLAGWWHDPNTGEDLRNSWATPYVIACKMALVNSEVAEAIEGHRKGLKDDKIPTRDMVEVELADAVIRIFDLAGVLGYDLGGAITEKLAYNQERPDHKVINRRKPGGKLY